MARRRKAVKMVGPLQAMHDRAAAEERQRPVVSEHAAQHGIFETHLGRTRNRAVSPVDKWIAEGMVSDSQQAAILHCTKRWECLDSSPRLVANLDRTVFGCPGDGHPAEIQAMKDIERMRDHVGAIYWGIFENVVRFGEPAGVVGSRLEESSRNREVAARNCVLFVADIITMRERLSY